MGEIDARPGDAARIEAAVKERALKALEGALLRPVQVGVTRQATWIILDLGCDANGWVLL